jgi:preprotein translocase subunit YajC
MCTVSIEKYFIGLILFIIRQQQTTMKRRENVHPNYEKASDFGFICVVLKIGR